MRRIVALLVLAVSPALALAEPAQAVPTTPQGEVQTTAGNGEDPQEITERVNTARPASTDARPRKNTRATTRPGSRAQSFLPGMFR